MKLIMLTAAAIALAALANATPAHAVFGTKTGSCSIAIRGHPRVTSKACTIDFSMAQGHAGFGVTTPNGRHFHIYNYYRDLGPDTAPTLWFIDGKPANLADGCYENRMISICFNFTGDPLAP